MFNLTPSEEFEAQVKTWVVQKNGTWKEESFFGVFKRTGDDDRERLSSLKNTDLLREVMVGWRMENLERKPVEFTPENFAGFLTMIGPVRDAALAYWNGNAGAKQKN